MTETIAIGAFNRGILAFCAAVMLVVGIIGFQQAAAVGTNWRTMRAWFEWAGMVLVAAVAIGLAVVLALLAIMVE